MSNAEFEGEIPDKKYHTFCEGCGYMDLPPNHTVNMELCSGPSAEPEERN